MSPIATTRSSALTCSRMAPWSTRDRLVPYTVFIDPELGRVGLTEQQAREGVWRSRSPRCRWRTPTAPSRWMRLAVS